MHKKVLIITYYWPPAGGPGVQRWLKFVKYLPEFGIDPIVYIPENPHYPLRDQSLIKDIPKDVTVIKQPIREPYQMAGWLSKNSAQKINSGIIPKVQKQSAIQKLMLYIRGNYFIPDARKAWVKPSVGYLLKYIQEHNIETVISTGPPHSLHLIGLQLKAQIAIKWIADFRDPWTTIGYHKKLKLSSRAAEKHQLLEKQVLNSADEIIVTSENTRQEFALKSHQPITVITNGYDQHLLPKFIKDKEFSLAHIGSLLSDRDPEILWKVLGEFIKEDPNFKCDFKLRLVGVVSDDVLHHIRNFIPKDNIEIVGYVSHDQALIYQRQSQLLALIEIDSQDTKAIIPGKLFEYLVAETPILAIGPKETDVERIINGTNTGQYFYYDSEAELKEYIKNSYSQFKIGSLKTYPVGLQQYSRKSLTKKLAELL